MHKYLFVTLSGAKGLATIGGNKILHCVQNDELGCISIRATGSEILLKPFDNYAVNEYIHKAITKWMYFWRTVFYCIEAVMLEKIKLYLTYLLAALSTILLFIPLLYIARYLADSGNPLRQELLVVVMIGFYIALFAWSITALFAYSSRSLLSKRALHYLYAPAITLAVLFVIFYLLRFVVSMFLSGQQIVP